MGAVPNGLTDTLQVHQVLCMASKDHTILLVSLTAYNRASLEAGSVPMLP